MAYQKCTCGNDTFRAISRPELYMSGVMLNLDGEIDYKKIEPFRTSRTTQPEEWDLVCENCEVIYHIVDGKLTPVECGVTSKDIIVKIHTGNEWYNDTADYLVATLDAPLIARIKKLAKAARDLNVYEISEFKHIGDFKCVDYDTEDTDNGKEILKDFEGRMECCSLDVSPDDFCMSGFYKHSDIRWETEPVSLVDLDSPEPIDEREVEVGPQS